MSPELEAVLEAELASVGKTLLDDLLLWIQGKQAPAPTLAQEQAALVAAADAEAKASGLK